jgi:hypothetical protein
MVLSSPPVRPSTSNTITSINVLRSAFYLAFVQTPYAEGDGDTLQEPSAIDAPKIFEAFSDPVRKPRFDARGGSGSAKLNNVPFPM